MRKLLQWLSTNYPPREHVGCKDPTCELKHDFDEWMKLDVDGDVCCGICGCCSCHSWFCNFCLWEHKLKRLNSWVWNDD